MCGTLGITAGGAFGWTWLDLTGLDWAGHWCYWGWGRLSGPRGDQRFFSSSLAFSPCLSIGLAGLEGRFTGCKESKGWRSCPQSTTVYLSLFFFRILIFFVPYSLLWNQYHLLFTIRGAADRQRKAYHLKSWAIPSNPAVYVYVYMHCAGRGGRNTTCLYVP